MLQRANLRTGEEEEKEADGQMFQLQLAQLVGVAVLLCAMYVTILIRICKIILETFKQNFGSFLNLKIAFGKFNCKDYCFYF